jgi:Flp pilus assembly protein TadG
MKRQSRSRKSQHGGTMVESALVLLVFAILFAALMEFGFTGFVANSVSFAAQRAARYAAVRGSGSGHPASAAEIQTVAKEYAAPLNDRSLIVTVTWTPDNRPGSSVRVQVAYEFRPSLMPVSASVLTLQGTASQIITQ